MLLKGYAAAYSVGAPFTSRGGRVVVPYNGVMGVPLFMKLGITGSRTITDFDFISCFTMRDRQFRAFCREHGLGRRKVTAVVSGGAGGGDALAYRAAEALGIRNILFLPDRKKFPGRLIPRAFYERNRRIAECCDVLLAVWDGKSHGTENTIACARRIGKPVFLIVAGPAAVSAPPENGAEKRGKPGRFRKS